MIIKELYKNKKIIIVFLIIIFSLLFIKNGGMRKTIENFENNGNVIDTLVNTYDLAERKVNDVFKKIDAKNVHLVKNINTTGGVISKGGMTADKNILAKGQIIAGSGKGKIDEQGVLRVQKICIGNTCITENNLKFLTNGFTLITKSNGHKQGGFIHTHSDGRLAYAPPGNKTTYKMV